MGMVEGVCAWSRGEGVHMEWARGEVLHMVEGVWAWSRGGVAHGVVEG